MTNAGNTLETLYTVQQIASLWNVSVDQVRKVFRGRRGIINVSTGPGKPAWRIPASLVLQVMLERGYDEEAAVQTLKAGSA